MSAPAGVLLARLEHELETAKLAVHASNYVPARDAIAKARELAEQLRSAL